MSNCIFSGTAILTNPLLTEQYRFPRSKKTRIRKKWAKNPRNFKPASYALKIGDSLCVHPALLSKLTKIARTEIERSFFDAVRHGSSFFQFKVPPIKEEPEPEERPIMTYRHFFGIQPRGDKSLFCVDCFA